MRSLRVSTRFGAVAIAALALGTGLSSAAAAPTHSARSALSLHGFTAVDGGKVSLSKANLLSTSTKPTMVILQLAGKPVTVTDANAATPMSTSQRASARAALVRAQAPVAAAATSSGAKVIASYQLAYNGIKVVAPANKIAQLGKIPGVLAVRKLTPKSFENIHGVPLVGAPQVWQGVGAAGSLTGEGMKIGIIDTGIDYTHADFGGPGTVQAYQDALATDTAPADPSEFGPNAPRVKGGIDLVGDAYNAAGTGAALIPHPDSNPLDCNSHGTHVAGTAAGSGVLSDGSTYTGPYGADTVSGHDWNVGPGVAPRASIYSIRVFGCTGSTDEVIDALEWAVANGMDVVNMSLGSSYGGANDPDAVATNNAANDGVIVSVSAGNSGPAPYIVGSPGTASGAITVAASDPTASNPGATVTLSTSPSSPITMLEENGVSVAGLGDLPVKVLRTSSGAISLGCDPNEYTAAGVAGDIVVVQRGTCARVARAIFGQEAGAAAVVMINNASGYPVFDGPITSNPDTGQQYAVTIPFLGALPSDTAALVAADGGGTASLADTTIANPGYLVPASFSSGGARTGDSVLKPDVTAPGVSIISAGMGTGTGILIDSGTSMAAPHTAGLAALVREAHHNWGKVRFWKAAIVNTASTSLVHGYTTRVAGAGLIQGPPAVATNTVALGDSYTATLSYRFAELSADYSKVHTVTLRNFGPASETFDIGHANDAGSPHSLVLPASVTVPAHGTATVPVELDVPAATAGDSSAFRDVAGLVTFTPHTGDNNDVPLSVPYYFVPLAASHVTTAVSTSQLARKHTATATVANAGGETTGTADWYSWGVSDSNDSGGGSADVRAVGVEAFPGTIAFGLDTYHRWSNPAANEYDIYVDVNNDGTDDYVVVAADLGLLQGATTPSGQDAVAVFNLASGGGSIRYLADAPFNSTTMVLPVDISQLCQSGAPCLSSGTNPRFSYDVASFGAGATDTTSSAVFNPFSPSVSTGMYDVVDPNTATTETVTVDPTEFAVTPALGFMVITPDNTNSTEARLIKLPPLQ